MRFFVSVPLRRSFSLSSRRTSTAECDYETEMWMRAVLPTICDLLKYILQTSRDSWIDYGLETSLRIRAMGHCYIIVLLLLFFCDSIARYSQRKWLITHFHAKCISWKCASCNILANAATNTAERGRRPGKKAGIIQTYNFWLKFAYTISMTSNRTEFEYIPCSAHSTLSWHWLSPASQSLLLHQTSLADVIDEQRAHLRQKSAFFLRCHSDPGPRWCAIIWRLSVQNAYVPSPCRIHRWWCIHISIS